MKLASSTTADFTEPTKSLLEASRPHWVTSNRNISDPITKLLVLYSGNKTVNRKILIAILAFIQTSCSDQDSFTISPLPRYPTRIMYISSDLSNAVSFSDNNVRFGIPGLPEVLWSTFELTRAETQDGLQCISTSVGNRTIDYAIRRPLNLGDEYSCRETTFRVVQCFNECRSAIVEIDRTIRESGNPGIFRASMLVDACRGVLIISEAPHLTDGIPLKAALLQGSLGILASSRYSECNGME